MQQYVPSEQARNHRRLIPERDGRTGVTIMVLGDDDDTQHNIIVHDVNQYNFALTATVNDVDRGTEY